MRERPTILVVAATTRELAPANGWSVLECGVGPVDAAAATAAALARRPPAAVLHVGIAGARRTSGLAPLALVIGSEARYCDLEAPPHLAARAVTADARLLAAAQHEYPEAHTLPIGTSARVGGTAGCEVEAMEGFAVLRAAELAGVPALEVRVISNAVEEQDRSRWQFDNAFAAIAAATPRLVAALARSLADA